MLFSVSVLFLVVISVIVSLSVQLIIQKNHFRCKTMYNAILQVVYAMLFYSYSMLYRFGSVD